MKYIKYKDQTRVNLDNTDYFYATAAEGIFFKYVGGNSVTWEFDTELERDVALIFIDSVSNMSSPPSEGRLYINEGS